MTCLKRPCQVRYKRFHHDLLQSQFSVKNASLNIQLTSNTDTSLPYTLYYILCVFVDCLIIDSFFREGATHCTNGIVIQRKPLTCAPSPEMAADESRPRRSRTLTYIPAGVLPFHSGSRQGASPFHIGVHDVIKINPDTGAYARSIDFGWMLYQQPIEDNLFT